ncbi:bifunctional tRNA (5-methylaminomethyl-2-thiouridine)(34)-methyltransferase MnmD/FAD-dependent 5-carboxymethylaminomethyl-2-thiouridine(34)oxidoreductase MnmC [Pandoraea terrae]|uniref:tRNA 5-methylaminomethyl-2-thiouridine biosynthesis bifunctional protein MnmC n=1 Tax=Pandoraea terrae TaxID=1537710 RepID=A0A5E4W1Z0_9BURK|nr:bifunctional tRNA (5-methylaminomethyl-2-thiouridine)(34)-methyltransferase MnmD/FAD-dependent 5-carboxymethylaminomethyl-2-thiouridine(34) oxidoreductase MnmC [Pandoraea terrae]VVE17574.1 bifunctional tRNA (5-methylaminomethyl-2-thiouridine)(34)-methyltransferase MnmD/FAD-dependent 5-carboxymethylaminomethyl-2-thiouridine(34)oxidoreductase MnmC [Pandoraea terrae]
MTAPIVPARPAFADNGTPFSDDFGDVYHSVNGALGQARHVFLGGNGLPQRWRGREQFVIVETGFGLGLNFLATWASWLADEQRPKRLHFVSVEKFPFRPDDLRRMLEATIAQPEMTELAPLAWQLCALWPLPLPGLHRLEPAPGLTLTVGFGDFFDVMPALRVGADAFFLDGFSPAKNPEMWTPAVFKTLARMARDGATISTYTAVGQIRRDLNAAGFVVERRPGFGFKRHMLAGHYAPPYKMRRYDPPAAAHPSRRAAIVVGAGMAGAAMANRLAVRGWQVTVFDRADGPGTAASGNPVGVFHPQLSADDNLLSRLTRAGFLYALSHWRALPGGVPGTANGLLQVATNTDEAAAIRRMVTLQAYPPEYVRWVEPDEASQLAGDTVSFGGLWFARGGSVSPARLCRAEIATAVATGRVSTVFGARAARLTRDGEDWAVLDHNDALLGKAPVVVLATADETRPLLAPWLPDTCLPIRAVRGQLTFLRAGSLPNLQVPVCGDGYVAPGGASDAGPVTGATYGFDDDGTEIRAAEHDANLARLAALLPGQRDVASERGGLAGLTSDQVTGRVAFRCLAPDRMPMAGQVPDMEAVQALGRRLVGGHLRDVPRLPGLYGSFALGSRGLVLAALCAELVASQIEGEPWPVTADLADAIDPARYLMHALRRKPV